MREKRFRFIPSHRFQRQGMSVLPSGQCFLMAWFSTSFGVLKDSRQPCHSHKNGAWGLSFGSAVGEELVDGVAAAEEEAVVDGGGVGVFVDGDRPDEEEDADGDTRFGEACCCCWGWGGAADGGVV